MEHKYNKEFVKELQEIIIKLSTKVKLLEKENKELRETIHSFTREGMF